jgi:hypothetical protein
MHASPAKPPAHPYVHSVNGKLVGIYHSTRLADALSSTLKKFAVLLIVASELKLNPPCKNDKTPRYGACL